MHFKNISYLIVIILAFMGESREIIFGAVSHLRTLEVKIIHMNISNIKHSQGYLPVYVIGYFSVKS